DVSARRALHQHRTRPRSPDGADLPDGRARHEHELRRFLRRAAGAPRRGRGCLWRGPGARRAGRRAAGRAQPARRVVSFGGVGAAALLTAISTTPLMLAASLTVLGLFAAIYHPVGTAMLVANAEKLGHTIGVNGVWGNMGVAAAAITAGTLTQYLGWRWAFVVPGLASIALGIVFHLTVPNLTAQKKAAARAGAA